MSQLTGRYLLDKSTTLINVKQNELPDSNSLIDFPSLSFGKRI